MSVRVQRRCTPLSGLTGAVPPEPTHLNHLQEQLDLLVCRPVLARIGPRLVGKEVREEHLAPEVIAFWHDPRRISLARGMCVQSGSRRRLTCLRAAEGSGYGEPVGLGWLRRMYLVSHGRIPGGEATRPSVDTTVTVDNNVDMRGSGEDSPRRPK